MTKLTIEPCYSIMRTMSTDRLVSIPVEEIVADIEELIPPDDTQAAVRWIRDDLRRPEEMSDAERALLYELGDHCLVLDPQPNGEIIVLIFESTPHTGIPSEHPDSQSFIDRYGVAPWTGRPESGLKVTGLLRHPTPEEAQWDPHLIFHSDPGANLRQHQYAHQYIPHLGELLRQSLPYRTS